MSSTPPPPPSNLFQKKKKDPYVILNVSRNATNETLQRSYKQLSRSFHPDKQRGSNDDGGAAQEVFIEFKNAYDILIDPVLRQAYDEHGYYGLNFIKRSMASSTSSSSTTTSSSSSSEKTTTTTLNIYQLLSKLHSQNELQKASTILNDAIQYYKYQMVCTEVQSSGGMEVCLNYPFLGGYGYYNNEEEKEQDQRLLQKASMSFSVSAPPLPYTAQQQQQQQYQSSQQQQQQQQEQEGAEETSPWSVTIGTTSTVAKGGSEGHANGQISVGYDIVQGTNVNFDVDVGEHGKVTLGTSRMTSSKTLISASVSTIPESNKLAFSLSSHRAILDNTLRAMWAMGISSDFGLHYCLLSFTTINNNGEMVVVTTMEENKKKKGQMIAKQKIYYPPKYTLKFNIGIDKLPIKIMVDKIFVANKSSGSCSFGWGPVGSQITASLSRVINKYARFTVGVQSSSIKRRLTWLFKIERGSMSLSIPVTVMKFQPGVNNFYSLVYLTLLSSLLDASIGDLLHDEKLEELLLNGSSGDDGDLITGERGVRGGDELSKERLLMNLEKAKRDAKQQMELMRQPAEEKRRQEEGKENGLVILKATYGLEPNTNENNQRRKRGDVLDVTIQLQFWVMNSSLRLPACTKCNMLGFYDVRLSSSSPQVNTRDHCDYSDGWGVSNSLASFWNMISSSWSTEQYSTTTMGTRDDQQQQQQNQDTSSDIPMLTVRYKFGNCVYEITIQDDEELILPCSMALCLGSSDLIS